VRPLPGADALKSDVEHEAGGGPNPGRTAGLDVSTGDNHLVVPGSDVAEIECVTRDGDVRHRGIGDDSRRLSVDDPVITSIAQRVHKTPAQVALAWAVQRGTAFLTTSTTPRYIQENFEISALPEDALQEMREGITTNVRFNTVVGTGVPGFIPRVS
jgi:hypothetical protein